MAHRITTPLSPETLAMLTAGDSVLLSGVIYTGRDAAHKRLCSLLSRGENLPVDLRGQTIYYVGPCPAPPGMVIGSCGPTTSYRMDAYAPQLIAQGLRGMIGKGQRSAGVIEAMKTHGAVYFAATGGAAALMARCVRECAPVAFHDLGTEAIHRLVVEDMPLIVATDAAGRDLYTKGPAAYRR